MHSFFDKARFMRHFPTDDVSFIRTVGYDDFRYVKPLNAFRVQGFYTLHFVLSGSGTLEIGKNSFFVTQGQMFFIPPGEKMRYYPDNADPWEYMWFSFTGDCAASYGKMLGFSVSEPVKTVQYFSGIKNRLQKLMKSLSEENGNVFSALSAFYGIMEVCTSELPATGVRAIKKHIDESFAQPGFRVEQLCHDAGFSHAHLLRLFRQTYGMTVIKYVIKKRIDYACELLISTDLSIQSIAFSCGFTDEIHFMKTFKREVGISALKYRKQNAQ
jgi:AraC-like DNA-binding protein